MGENNVIDVEFEPEGGRSVLTCGECPLHCEYRGVSPLSVKVGNEVVDFSCVVMSDAGNSCLVMVPVRMLLNPSTGDVVRVDVEAKRLWRKRKWKQRKL